MTSSLVLRKVTALILLALLASSCNSITQRPPTPAPTSHDRETPEVTHDGLPDLIMEYHWNVRYTSDCPWGGPGYVIMRGSNVGEGRAEDFHIRVWDQLTFVEELTPGEQIEARADFESGPVGSIPAMIDSENEVEESDEDNNEVLIVFTPPPKCTPEGD